jgi:hypothetical protein
MNKGILLAIGVAGTMWCNPGPVAYANAPLAMGDRDGVSFSIQSRPDFIYLDDYGFSVSYGGPYNVIYDDGAYFVFRNGYWYRSRDYRGPWGRIRDNDLPGRIRAHRWNDIERRRDMEYRRYDRRIWDERFRRDRERWRDRDGRPGPGGSPGPGRDWRDGR